jgi:hypothetical protein
LFYALNRSPSAVAMTRSHHDHVFDLGCLWNLCGAFLVTSARDFGNTQQPLQMLFTLRSIARSSAAIAASELLRPFGSVTAGPGADCPPDPVVTPGCEFMADPVDCAVPALFVPGEASLAELPAPLGSLSELLTPPVFAGPGGTPLTPAVPAPGEPALGLPTACGLADAPLAAPPALAPPPPAPPEPPPPPPCAKAAVELTARSTIAAYAPRDDLDIGNLLLGLNHSGRVPFPERIGIEED